MASRRV
ncbi:hypothetical protein EYF80_065035 [Liparis tanakae]|nr:hypothetical protein EYF80_065035 [Liparis tanakae]